MSILFILLISCLAAVYVIFKSMQKRNQLEPPVLSGGSFFTGYFTQILNNPMKVIRKAKKELGTTVFHTSGIFGIMEMNHIFGEDAWKLVFSSTERDLSQRDAIKEYLKGLLGNFIPSYEEHDEENQIVAKAIKTSSKFNQDNIVKAINYLLEEYSKKKEFNLVDFIEDVVFRINISNFLGDEGLEKIHVIRDLVHDLEAVGFHPLTVILPGLPFGPPKVANKTRETLGEVLAPFVQKRRENKEMASDYISVWSQAIKDVGPKKGSPFTIKEITRKIVEIMIAAHVNTAVTMCWSLLDLYRSPVAMEKLRKEISEMEKEGKEIHQGTYIIQCQKETMRLHTMNPVIRKVKRDLMFNGYLLKKDSILTCSTVIVDEERFPDITAFNPERWDSNTTISSSPTSFVAFSAGAHRCKGDIYSMQVLKSVVAQIVKDWDLEFITKNLDNFYWNSSVKPTHKVLVSLKKRH